MRKGTLGMGFSSSNELVERQSTCKESALLQADLEWIDNPFRNLHPKIYLRQKKVSSKMIKDSKRETKTDITSGALLSLNVKNNHQTKLEKTGKPILQNAAKKHPLGAEKVFNTDYYLTKRDKITYLNQRNISVSKESASEKGTLSLPLIVTPRKISGESKEPLRKLGTAVCESNTNYLPRIRYSSFLSLVYEEEKKMEIKWQKKAQYTTKSTATTCEPQIHAESLSTCATESDKHKKSDNVLKSYKGVVHSDEDRVKGSVNATNTGSRTLRNYRTSLKTVSKYKDTGEGVNSDTDMVLRAKIHRSSFS